MSSGVYDAAVIGGGPAGLTAAIYLARYHLSVFVADEGNSRAALIPMTHNQPSWPEGISGTALLARMRDHVSRYPVDFRRTRVSQLSRLPNGFELVVDSGTVAARAVILATGVRNRRPAMPADLHDAALRDGLLRYCPICDGYEVTDQDVAVIGTGDSLFGEAKFLRSYTARVTALSETGAAALSERQRNQLSEMNVRVVDAPVTGYRLAGDGIEIQLGEECRRFDTLYAALGSDIRSELAVGLGVHGTEDGCILVDDHQRTSTPGLYAAGDVVFGVDQIGHAIGQAAVAATALRNDLCQDGPLLR